MVICSTMFFRYLHRRTRTPARQRAVRVQRLECRQIGWTLVHVHHGRPQVLFCSEDVAEVGLGSFGIAALG